MFENKLTHNGIHYSRYIVSWQVGTGRILTNRRDNLFEVWLKEVQKLTDEEISDIHELYANGKLELQTSAKMFMKSITK